MPLSAYCLIKGMDLLMLSHVFAEFVPLSKFYPWHLPLHTYELPFLHQLQIISCPTSHLQKEHLFSDACKLVVLGHG